MTLEENEKIFLCDTGETKIDFARLFGNEQPVHLEIGCGRGEFITEIALLEPEINFLGLEIKKKRITTILKKLDPEKHKNIRLMMVLVDDQIVEKMQPSSVERIYIYHPDPWPKRKHFKNRLIQEDFLQAMSKILQDEGEVIITTDHEGYMNWIVKHFQKSEDYLVSFPEGYSREPFDGHIETHFEQKLKKKGYPSFYMKFIKNRVVLSQSDETIIRDNKVEMRYEL